MVVAHHRIRQVSRAIRDSSLRKSLTVDFETPDSETLLSMIEIDYKVYREDCLDTLDNAKAKLEKFPQTYAVLRLNGEVIGYSAMYPISGKTLAEAIRIGDMSDSEISCDSVDLSSRFLYISSITLLPEYQDGVATEYLREGLVNQIRRISLVLPQCEKIVANVVSDQGEKFFRRLGFTDMVENKSDLLILQRDLGGIA